MSLLWICPRWLFLAAWCMEGWNRFVQASFSNWCTWGGTSSGQHDGRTAGYENETHVHLTRAQIAQSVAGDHANRLGVHVMHDILTAAMAGSNDLLHGDDASNTEAPVLSSWTFLEHVD